MLIDQQRSAPPARIPRAAQSCSVTDRLRMPEIGPAMPAGWAQFCVDHRLRFSTSLRVTVSGFQDRRSRFALCVRLASPTPKLGLAILSAERYSHEKRLGVSQGSDVLNAEGLPHACRESLGRNPWAVRCSACWEVGE
jgi:hypothetical protein